MVDQLLRRQAVGPHPFIGGGFNEAVAEGKVSQFYWCKGFLHLQKNFREGKNDFKI
jgi:hypothetical protein